MTFRKSSLLAFVVMIPFASSTFGKGILGELISASNGTTINQTQALSGTTIFTNSRVKTGANGVAVVSLGQQGRIELGSSTEISLQFSNGMVGGTLLGGKVIVSVPSGVNVNLITPDGSVASLTSQSSRFAVDVTAGKTNVVATRGAAKVSAGGRISVIGVLGLNGQVQGIARNASVPENSQVLPPASPMNPAFTVLLKASAGQSLALFLANRITHQPGGFFDTGVLTCRDYIDTPRCRQRSPIR